MDQEVKSPEQDFVLGRVVYAINNNEFNIKVTYFGENNKLSYNPNEIIIIRDFISYADGIIKDKIKTAAQLESALRNLALKCIVHRRDNLGRLISDVIAIG